MTSKFKNILNKKRLSIAGWLIAAVLILALTGAEMVSLLTAPPVAESQELRSTRRNLRELEAAIATNRDRLGDAEKLDRVLIAMQSASSTSSAGLMDGAVVDTADLLPKLTGITRIQSVDGRVVYRATLDGQDMGEREKLDGFTILKIADKGVTVIKAGKPWLLRAPEASSTVRRQ